MKRMMGLLLAVLALLLVGCGAEAAAETTGETEGNVKTVSTVDEFLCAIGPDAEIVLEPGEYDLQDASDYGLDGADYYGWTDVYDGYGLKISGVENLTIRGAGMGQTTLSAGPGYADVLTFQNCDGLVLEDFTAGHTERPGYCVGGVIAVDGCRDVSLNRLGLYGCGVVGVRGEMNLGMQITDCDIYDCSNSGISLLNCNDILVDNCRFYELGSASEGVGQVMILQGAANVEVSNCEIRDNTLMYLIALYDTDRVTLKNNTITRNRAQAAAFHLNHNTLTLEGNTFEDNNFRAWRAQETGRIEDGVHQELTDEWLDQQYRTNAEILPAGDQTEIRVKTVDELLGAIGPDMEIILEEKLYDLSTASDYGTGSTDYYYWEEQFDGPNLVITGVNNMTIRSEDGKTKNHTIAVIPRYAHVLTFSQCSNISLSGFTAGHTEEPGYCIGGVLLFRDSDKMRVDNCGLYGCGILGIQAEYGSDLTVQNCDIYECSQGGIALTNVDGVTIESCTFRNLGGDSLMLSGCRDIIVNGEEVPMNFFGEPW